LAVGLAVRLRRADLCPVGPAAMSTRPVAPDHIPVGWEEVNRITNRLAVPGGWVYEVRNAGVVFVPEPAESDASADKPAQVAVPAVLNRG
jgi:hypothetical protein